MLNYFLINSKIVLTHLAIFLVPFFVLAFLSNIFSKASAKYGCKVFGKRIYLLFFGWIGTLVHETGHIIMCVIFRHKITEVKLFELSPTENNLGYVHHSYNHKSIYQVIGNFFIGIGPLILGIIVINLCAYYLMSHNLLDYFTNINYNQFFILREVKTFFLTIFNFFHSFFSHTFTLKNLSNWKFYLLLYIFFSVGSRMALSKKDIKGSFYGLILFLIILIIACVTLLLIDPSIYKKTLILLTSYFYIFYSTLIIAILINTMLLIVLFIFSKILHK